MRETEARRITQAQVGIHKNLHKVVKKHLESDFQKPISEHTQLAFNRVRDRVEKDIDDGMTLIFDSCCGTAVSTKIIAQQNPGSLVIGVDRSAVRLTKEYNDVLPDNALLIQAECADFWQLAKSAGWKLHKHTILYPNPYPKAKHLKRRWHGHPAFPLLLSLGGELELRTNWKVYADEFCEATNMVNSYYCEGTETIQIEKALTLFEKKYCDAGQEIYKVKISL